MASTVAARVVPGRLSIKKQLRRTAPLKNVWKIVDLFTFFPYGDFYGKKGCWGQRIEMVDNFDHLTYALEYVL